MSQDSMAYLTAELQRLDLLLHREILRLRARYQLSLDEFRGLYISDEQVDRLIEESLGGTAPDVTVAELTCRAHVLRLRNAEACRADSPWQRLAAAFALTPLEQELLLIAAAPEFDLKYEALYAYLNNDVTR
ncbi:MAG: ATP-binding protein, partial [Blastocatellia bacterium]